MDESGTGEIQKRPGDYAHRTGVSHPPMVKHIELTLTMPVLHEYLCSLRFFEGLAYRLNARASYPEGDIIWGTGQAIGAEAKKGMADAKAAFQKASKAIFGKPLDAPNPQGGTSDTGKVKDFDQVRFFYLDFREPRSGVLL